jgi:NADH:ubiquinone oxidoreductase subunit F (NADH-binding)
MTPRSAEACTLDYEGVVECGSMLGCASVIVMDDSTNIVKQVRRMVDFYAHESCGQCTPCREGTQWLSRILEADRDGRGTEEDLDTLLELGDQMTGTTICVLSDSAAAPVPLPSRSSGTTTSPSSVGERRWVRPEGRAPHFSDRAQVMADSKATQKP